MKNMQIPLTLGVIALMVVFSTSENKTIGIATGIPLLVFLIWSFIIIQKSNIDSTVKRISFVSIIVIFSIAARLYLLIMS